MLYVSRRKNDKCEDCGFCRYFISCSNPCTGCGACVKACPYEAIELCQRKENKNQIEILINGKIVTVPLNITVLKALELHGYKISHHHPESGDIFAPCATGGCGACAVLINGKLKPSCVTPVKPGMEINTEPANINKVPPQMIASQFIGSPHSSTGISPYLYNGLDNGLEKVEEISCILHGCNLNCPACQNWNLTFSSIGKLSTPQALASQILDYSNVSWTSVSGGEPTLNRRWLIEYLSYLRFHVPGMRLHLDTNGTILSTEYMKELNNLLNYVTLDIKGASVEVFQALCGIKDYKVALSFMENSWNALEYLFGHCDNIFVVACIPFHPEYISQDELEKIGKRLASISPEIPVSVLEYHAAFRKRNLSKIKPEELKEAYNIMKRYVDNVQIQFSSTVSVDPQDIILSNDSGY